VTTAAVAPATRHAAPYVERITIRTFRGIVSCEVEFEPGLTLLVGRNNVGKSRVLSALHLALGGRVADVDDFTVGSSAEPEIDVVLAPSPPPASTDEQAFEDDEGRLMGGDAQTISDPPFRERFAWRTHVRRSAEGLGARSEFKILTFDAASGNWVERSGAKNLGRDARGLVASDLVNTGRDLMEELGRRGSGVRKVLSDLDVDDVTRADLELRLAGLSADIVAGSGTLASVSRSLDALNRAVGSIGAPGINPIPITLEELARSLSIDLDSGHGALPIRMHGAGARSLASLQIQGVLYERLLGADGGSLRPHPVTLVEEPEAHLHPQAASELPHLLTSIRGQVVASTHSSQVVTASDPRAIRLLREDGGSLAVVDLGPAPSNAPGTPRPFRPSHHTEEMEKLKRLAERPFGEILFASAIVVGDGATERGFLPPVLRHALGAKAHGVCVIDPESMATQAARAVAKFASAVGVPWFIFADSDPAGVAAVEALATTGTSPATVIWVGKPDSAAAKGVSGAIEAMIVDFDEDVGRTACERVRPDLAPVANVLSTMKDLKGSIGQTLADVLLSGYEDSTTWPSPVQELIQAIDGALS
jgi:putative ATP-dependent endonuclease of OLD family